MLTFDELEELPFIPKPVPDGHVSCTDCGGIGTVPLRKPNPAWDGKDPEEEYLAERWPGHEHGSEVCSTCGGNGSVES